MNEQLGQNDYYSFLKEVETKIASNQIKAAVIVNSILIDFYWELGELIVKKQKDSNWGDKILSKLSKDLKIEFPDLKGFSPRNLKYCRQFYGFYTSSEIGQHGVAQLGITEESSSKTSVLNLNKIPWSHNIIVFSKSKTIQEAEYYINKTIQENWSRDVLALQIKSNLYERDGKSINNFELTLPQSQSDLANQIIKDPYVFDFLTLEKSFKEREFEKELVNNITKFLLELGKGFAFIGQQYHLEVAQNDYYIDLLFYHVVLKCYVVIELKNTKFIPEYAGKMNFYLSAVDSCVKNKDDNPTIGIILCREKNNLEAEFALRDLNKPMGVSEFEFTSALPENLKSSLPTIEELENELKSFEAYRNE